ncbi:hypothetical protein KP77_04410 [Jeotgalibacillus alimentarius]|uniref:Uncharacterized protein n=1 Tax=Jeotgalibacillus alimentarius TaxID=135826 RepID=A0A0C2RTA4_9BACL|nr:hypothetical protein KP77_04410 [Jeotgalibacillus alimentarius]
MSANIFSALRMKVYENQKLHVISTGRQKPEQLADIIVSIDTYIFVKKHKYTD